MPQTVTIRLSSADAEAGWAGTLRTQTERALDRTQKRLGLTLNGTLWVRSFATERAFHDYLGQKPEHVVAVARPARSEIIINRPAFFAASPAEQQQVMVHEMAHLILGRRVNGRLPAWLNEGLAMITAGENSFDHTMRVTLAGTLGGLLPLELLMDQVAIGGASQALAYSQSLALTRFYLPRALPDQPGSSDDPAPLARALADPHSGPILLRRLWDPNFRFALNAQWRRSQRTLWSFLATFSGAGFIWGVITVLFLLAYWRKRRMTHQIRERFGDEEDDEPAEPDWSEPAPWERDEDER